MARQRFSRGAAASVALFVLRLLGAPLALSAFVSTAEARMPVEALTIVPAAGGAGHAFEVEVAKTDQEKALGLMFRTHLADNAGMLFWYRGPQDITMWMRNTYIPLDMVFIREDGSIARIEENTEPMSERIIHSGARVNAVLELAGGAAARLGIKPGDRVRHRFFSAARER